MSEKKPESKEPPKVSYKVFNVDFNSPCSNNLLTLEGAQKYLKSNFKINGLKGKLEDKNAKIKVAMTDKKDKRKNTLVISVDNKLQFSKRYIKYLVKKYLRREGISRFLTVSSTAPNAYTVKVIKKNEE